MKIREDLLLVSLYLTMTLAQQAFPYPEEGHETTVHSTEESSPIGTVHETTDGVTTMPDTDSDSTITEPDSIATTALTESDTDSGSTITLEVTVSDSTVTESVTVAGTESDSIAPMAVTESDSIVTTAFAYSASTVTEPDNTATMAVTESDMDTTAGTESDSIVTTAFAHSDNIDTTAFTDSHDTEAEVFTEPDSTVSNSENLATLAVTDSDRTGAGDSMSTASTDFFSANPTTVAVPMPPSIIRGPLEIVIFRSGDNVTLDCKAKGVPDVTYEWKKNGIELNQTLQNSQRGADGAITIQSATSMDEDFYQCFVRNPYGTAVSQRAHLQMAFLDPTAINATGILNITVQEGRPFHIPCYSPNSFPKPTYGWEMINQTGGQNANLLQLSQRIQIAPNGDLHFSYALPGDDLGGSFYVCTTYNSFLGVEANGNYTQVTVIRNRNRSISEFAPSLAFSSIEILKGVITFRCFFYAYPLPAIVWIGPNDTLPVGRYTLDSFNISLTKNNSEFSDEGDYTCVASNTKGRSNGTHSITVGVAPVFRTVKDGLGGVSATDGDSVTFNCNATARPQAHIVWLRDGKKLDPDNLPERFEFSDNNRSLTIRNVCRDCVDGERKTDIMAIQCTASNLYGHVTAYGYLNVGYKYCNNEVDVHSIRWSRTRVGTEITRTCPVNRFEQCSRNCLQNGWNQTDCNRCYDKKFKDLLKWVGDLNTTTLKSDSVIAEFTNQLSVLTNKSDGLSASNLNASVMMLNQLAILRSNSAASPSEKEIKSFVEAASNVLRPISSGEWKELEAVNKTFASIILSSVEVYGRSLSRLNTSKLCNTENEANLVLEARSLQTSKQPLRLDFPNCSAFGDNAISIFMDTPNSSISAERFLQPSYMWASYYPTIHNFLPGNKDFGDVISTVLSFSIDGLKPKEKLKQPVLITLRHNQEESLTFQRTCVSWDFDRGDWDSTGCSVKGTDLGYTICSCDHLTNFAILMSRNPSMSTTSSHSLSLSIISYIGCSISLVALVLTIIVYASTWKQCKSAQAAVLLNLCVALIIAYTIFMAGADKVDSKDGCTVVAALLHYFFLAAFFIMLAEGVELLLYIIFVFHVRTTTETVMLIVSAWVLPLIIVAISLGSTNLVGYGNHGSYGKQGNDSSHGNYGSESPPVEGEGYHSDDGIDDNTGKGLACWLSVENGLIWAFVGPVLCIIAVNFVILIVVLIWMSKRRSFLVNNVKKRSEIRATLWNLSVICPVLGLGWLIGVFLDPALIPSSSFVVLEYFFVISNSLQGLFIFIFHALLRNKTVKEKISYVYTNYICCCCTTVYEVSDKTSSTRELAKKAEQKPSSIRMFGHDNEGMEKQDILLSSGTQTTSDDESGMSESKH